MGTKTKQESNASGLLSELPVDRLKDELMELGKAMAQRGISRLGQGMSGATDKVGDLADATSSPAKMAKSALKVASPLGSVTDAAAKVKDALPGTGSGDDDDEGTEKARKADPTGDDTDLKVTNIVETIDVPVDRETAYDLWTQFEQFPAFMKKVETVKQKNPQEITWKAQVFWSHRTWRAKIVDQTRPEHIVWKSEGEKGRVDGAVTFHELAPDLTRVLVSLEYHPQGLFERTGNLWRAQGRRVRLELKHYRRHVANHALLHQDEIEGWEGEIHDGKVQKRSQGSAAKKSGTQGGGAKKSTAKKSAGSAAKKSTASRSSGSTAKTSAAKKSTARKSTPKKSTGPAAKKSTAKKSPAKKTTAKKSGGRTPAKRTAAAAKRSSTTSARASSPRKTAARKTSQSSSSAKRSTRSRS